MLLTDPPYGTTRNFWDVPLPLPELWEAVKWAVKPEGAVLFFAQCPYDKVLEMCIRDSGVQRSSCRQKWRLFSWPETSRRNGGLMQFFASAVTTLQTLVVALGAGLAVWGVVNLLEGYGSDNAAAKSQGIKQLMAGGGIIVLGTTLIPLLSTLF